MIFKNHLFPILIACIFITSCGDDESVVSNPVMASLPVMTPVFDSEFTEGQDTSFVEVKLKLDKASRLEIKLRAFTSDDLAIGGTDFVSYDEEIIIPPSSLSYNISIPIIGDDIPEESETFYLNFENIENAILSTNRIQIIILDEDSVEISPPDTLPFFVPETGFTSPMSYPGLNLVWNDEFDGDELDQNFWTYEIGTGGSGWGNNELQYYTDSNTIVKEGFLVIEAEKENINNNNYTSSRIVTMDKFEFRYGRVDIRAALPYGQGIWPALWMLGASFPTQGWPNCGETDIMELIGGGAKDAEVHGTSHWSEFGNYASQSGKYTLPSGIFYEEFHVFSIAWNANFITWYVDDIQYHQLDIRAPELSEFRRDFFFIFNVAVGGNWPGSPNASTVFPQRMIIDYIRVFQI